MITANAVSSVICMNVLLLFVNHCGFISEWNVFYRMSMDGSMLDGELFGAEWRNIGCNIGWDWLLD